MKRLTLVVVVVVVALSGCVGSTTKNGLLAKPRCDEGYGRPDGDTECRDTNPGTYR